MDREKYREYIVHFRGNTAKEILKERLDRRWRDRERGRERERERE